MHNMEALYDELVGLCYECVLDPNAWLTLLERLMPASGRQQSVLLTWDQRNAGAQVTSLNLCSPALIDDYARYYCNIDPTQEFMIGRAPGHWFFDFEEMGAERMARNVYYQELYRPHGVRNTSCLKLYEDDGVGAYLSLLSNRDARHPDHEQQALLQRLAPHLTRAGRLINRLNALQLSVEQRDLLLDQHRTPLWLLDGHGRVLYSNNAARESLRQPDAPLAERAARLQCKQLDTQLQTLLRRAIGRDLPGRPGCLQLPGNCQLLTLPLAAHAPLNRELQRPLVLAMLLEPRSPTTLLAELFELSPAEQRLADLLIQGLTPKECASQLGVSINTIRSHLRALLRKTNTDRQAELTALIARLGHC